jgi:phage terminase large subunit
MNLSFEVTPVFEKNFDSDKRIIINRGGTRSSKTYSMAQIFVLRLLTRKKWLGSLVMETLPALKATALRDVLEVIEGNGLNKFITHHKTEHTFSYKNNILEYFSVDNQQKVRGRKRNDLWISEANGISLEKWRQLILRTTNQAFLDFNPDDEDIWINTELEQKRQHEKKDVEVIISSYKDNTFLDETTIKEIEYLREVDEQYWQIFGLGEYGKVTGRILNNWSIVDSIPEGSKFIANGLDFGFTNDPTAMLEVYLNNGELWINELIYQRGLTNPDISSKAKEIGIDIKRETVADSAEPKSIQELENLGWRINPAQKGQDSIKSSIDILKRYKINVTSKSVNLIKELKTYKWIVDKNGKTLNEPVDYNNHLIDSLRYVALNKLNINKVGRYSISIV